MIRLVKSYQKGDTQIFMKQEDETYNVIRLVKSNDSKFVPRLNFDDALEMYDYFMDMEEGNDK